MGGSPFVNVIIYTSDDKEIKEILSNKVAEVYGATILYTLENLKCSKEQKLKLLDEIQNFLKNNI